jgi:hypothetical protein
VTGRIHRAAVRLRRARGSSADGGFSTVAPTGEYAVTTESQAGLAVGHAPVRVAVADGLVASADVELVSVASAMTQDPAAAGAGAAGAAAASAAQAPAADAQAPPAATQAPVYAQTTGTGAQIQFSPVTCFIAGEFPLLERRSSPPLRWPARGLLQGRGR